MADRAASESNRKLTLFCVASGMLRGGTRGFAAYSLLHEYNLTKIDPPLSKEDFDSTWRDAISWAPLELFTAGVSISAVDNDTPAPKPATPVDAVIDQLDRRIVPPSDRTRLREAVDRAYAPQKGRAGSDEGLLGVTKRKP